MMWTASHHAGPHDCNSMSPRGSNVLDDSLYTHTTIQLPNFLYRICCFSNPILPHQVVVPQTIAILADGMSYSLTSV
jgi:hypothetical protein